MQCPRDNDHRDAQRSESPARARARRVHLAVRCRIPIPPRAATPVYLHAIEEMRGRPVEHTVHKQRSC